jgi:DNA repair protein RecN (Recombination protein N)
LRAWSPEEPTSPERLDQLNARLALLQKLFGKYRTDLPGLLALRDRRAEEIRSLDEGEGDESEWMRRRDEARDLARKHAAILTQSRQSAASAFDSEVNRRLQELGMAGSRFSTHIRPRSDSGSELGSTGADHVEFHLAANPGEAERPLRQSASGGEISRVMLAIKTSLATGDTRPLLVFDELDAGIGGETGQKVGEALKELSRHHQLLVITHLHQVAAMAAHQIQVAKTTAEGRTSTRLETLEPKARVAELARMLGDSESEVARKHARQLLAQAHDA